jgi:TetR/AcrR family transcriptional repressor of lmrAB and yxaGH operons
MAMAKIGDAELAEKLAQVFRKLGYEGSSLGLISKSTGLEKASLYHRFPGGKEEMAAAAVAQVGDRFGREVLAALAGTGTPVEKLRLVQRGLRSFYEDGDMPCALDTLSLAPVNPGINEGLRQSYSGWLAAFAGLVREAGFSIKEAKRRAQQAIVQIEGALVLARVLGDSKPFRQAVASLPDVLLTKPQ